jgi:hypothetical protein
MQQKLESDQIRDTGLASANFVHLSLCCPLKRGSTTSRSPTQENPVRDNVLEAPIGL